LQATGGKAFQAVTIAIMVIWFASFLNSLIAIGSIASHGKEAATGWVGRWKLRPDGSANGAWVLI
jgi:hypothetical protein